MSSPLILVANLSKQDIENRRKYIDSRNLFVKYSIEQLEEWMKIDLYEALDLDFYRDKEIPADILEYTYKKKSAQYHPTKNNGLKHAFLIIKKAYTIFTNPKLRKVYDSCFLDESLPDDKNYELEEFLNIFSEVFERNAIFSEVKPVPKIRDNVEIFYKFWQSFKTIRVYDDPEDVFDVNGSSRRYAAEKNKEIMQEKKLKDLHRIQELVKLAIKCDPRIPKKNIETSNWDDVQLKSLTRFDTLFGKSANKFELIAKKLNDLYLTKRTPSEIKLKLEEAKKKK